MRIIDILGHMREIQLKIRIRELTMWKTLKEFASAVIMDISRLIQYFSR